MHYDIMARLYSTCSGFRLGESVLLVDSKLRQYLIKLVEGGCFRSHVGHVTHKDILDNPPGETLTTSKGAKVTVRHPLLWEYVRLMPRGPTPSYPKDIWTILGLLDINPGTCVLEAGSGSGALTLHLSRAVGPSGRVYSFDNSPEHLWTAENNYNAWARANEWPDNVSFVLDGVENTGSYCQTPLDGVALDLVEPSTVLSGVLPLMKPGASLVAYLPNVSQLMDLSQHVQSQPLEMARVLEVIHRDWTVQPARLKHGTPSTHYIARPSHKQQPHTGFLAHLRMKP